MDDKVKIIELKDRILELEKELLKMQEDNQKLRQLYPFTPNLITD